MKRFVRIRESEFCPICNHKGGWCCWANDGDAVLCARVPSSKKVGDNGAGWLHRLSDPRPVAPVRHRETPIPDRDWSAFQTTCVASLPDDDSLADELGISQESVGLLGLGWSAEHGAYTFPMRDGDGNIIGMRTRYRNGTKRAVLGSRSGLFLPRMRVNGVVWICEGPTDCAAVLTLGFFSLGRPSNTGGREMMVRWFERHTEARDIAILADRDANPQAESLTMNAVGELAESLKKLRRHVRVVRPQRGYKDVRSWVNDGLSADTLESVRKDALPCQ